jgi:hypothetical protein
MLSNIWISVNVLRERTFKRLAQLELEFRLRQWTDFCFDMVSLRTAVQFLRIDAAHQHPNELVFGSLFNDDVAT